MSSNKADLESILGVLAGLNLADPDDVPLAVRYIAKMKKAVAAMEATKDTVITATNPWEFTVEKGFCFGGKYVVKAPLSEAKPIYLCSRTLFEDAEDTIGIEVVVKCTFVPKEADEERVKRIAEQEKRSIRAIGVDTSDCPYSAGLIDAGELTTPEGRVVVYWQAFKSMKCDAKNLQSTMDGDIPPFIIMQMARQIIDALVYYHGVGIFHRDIKPHNILCAWPEHPSLREIWKLLINFALTDAQLVMGTVIDSKISEKGMLVGTPQYMPPEQILDPGSVTDRSDIWSLAVTLYELATGEFPHPVITSRAGLRNITHEKPKLFSRHLKAIDYPQCFQDLMDQSLSMDPKARPSAYDWFVTLYTQDVRMSLTFETTPLFLLEQSAVLPPE